MQIEIKAHPNYIKVLNTLVWFFLGIMVSITFLLNIHAFIKVSTLLLFIYLGNILIRYFFLPYLNRSFKLKITNFSDLIVRSTPLHRAFGVRTIQLGVCSVRGVHIDDIRRLKIELECQ